MIIVVVVRPYDTHTTHSSSSAPIVYRCTMTSASGRLFFVGSARLQIQHISVLWAGVEQPLLGRKIAMMVVVVVVTAVVVVFRLDAKDGAGAGDGGELGVVRSGRAVGTLAGASAAEDASGETAGSVLQLAAATVSGMFSVAFRTDGHTAPHGPVAPEAGQTEGQRAQQAPPRRSLVRQTRAGIFGAGYRVAFALHLVVLRAVVVQGLDDAQTGRVVDDGLRAAQTAVVAEPPRGQLPRPLALLAATLFTVRTGDGVK